MKFMLVYGWFSPIFLGAHFPGLFPYCQVRVVLKVDSVNIGSYSNQICNSVIFKLSCSRSFVLWYVVDEGLNNDPCGITDFTFVSRKFLQWLRLVSGLSGIFHPHVDVPFYPIVVTFMC